MNNKIIKYAVVIAVFLFLGIVIFFQARNNTSLRNDRDRHANNFNNANQEIQVLKAKNGDYYYQVNQLTLKKNELEQYSKELSNEVKNLKTKVKNLESVTVIETVYKTTIDTIFKTDTLILKDTVQQLISMYKYEDDYITVTAEEGTDYLSNVEVNLHDTLIVISETKYKGWWFWRKPIYSIIKIKSENPYLNIEQIESIKFEK